MKTGDIVLIDTLGEDLHVIIGQAIKGYWVQNLRTGALPTKQHLGKSKYSYSERKYITPSIVGGFMPKDMTYAGARYVDLDHTRASEWVNA